MAPPSFRLAPTCLIFALVFIPISSSFQLPSPRQRSTALHVVKPVGQFCPFRTRSMNSKVPQAMDILSDLTGYEIQMQRLTLDLEMGNEVSADRFLKAADDTEAIAKAYLDLNMGLKYSDDFQTREFFALNQADLSECGMTVERTQAYYGWQVEMLRCMAANKPDPPVPEGIDLEKILEANAGKPPITSLESLDSIRSDPFKPDAFKTPAIQEEYDQLVQDHKGLLDMGSRYGQFDPLGRIAFLDQVAMIEDRWDVFYLRFELMGAINPDFKKECDEYLEWSGYDEAKYRELHKKGQRMMREQAEFERDGIM